jgi:hypothetical protein
MASITMQRNKLIVGNNSKSYNDKHKSPAISLRPIRDAIYGAGEHFSRNTVGTEEDRRGLFIKYRAEVMKFRNSPRCMIPGAVASIAM